ncbi:MAG TPA: hypothetical protein VNW51_03155, partial [Mucilaginibacter sp.]|nr:hypothetical protein [Mucilaginibacter sp.]
KTAHLINEHNISCTLIFGKHDQLFPMKAAMPFINLLKNPVVHEVNMGHWLVTPALDEYLANLVS